MLLTEGDGEYNTTDTLGTFHYAGGNEPKPEVNPNHPRIYMHKFNIKSEIACCLMTVAGVKFQKVLFDNAHRAEWHDKEHLREIPLLETPDGKIEGYNHILKQYTSVEEFEQACKYTSLCDKQFATAWGHKFENEEANQALKEALVKVDELIGKTTDGADWLSGGFEPNAVDILTFGMFERLVMLKKTLWHKHYVALDIPDRIFAWVFKMKKHPHFKDHCITKEDSDAHVDAEFEDVHYCNDELVDNCCEPANKEPAEPANEEKEPAANKEEEPATKEN